MRSSWGFSWFSKNPSPGSKFARWSTIWQEPTDRWHKRPQRVGFMQPRYPRILLHCVAGAMIGFALLCPVLWGEAPASHPKVLTALWQKQIHAQPTGLDLSKDGQTVAFTTAPLASEAGSQL